MPPRSSRSRVAAAPQKVQVAAPPAPARAPEWLRWVVLGLAGFVLIGKCAGPVADTDAWWHLKTGQYIVQQHKLPVPDPFAWTTYMWKPAYAGEEVTRYFNLTHEWLAQVFFYGTYALGGFPAMVLMRAAWMTAFCGLAGWVVWRRTGRFYRAIGAALATMAVAQLWAADRPQYLTYVFLALTIAILESRRRLWLLPVLLLVWANCHAGFVLGWAAMGVYCGEALWLRLRGKPPADERMLWGASLGAILISGLNPNGFRVLQVMRYYRLSSMQSQIWEWQFPKYWEISPFTVLLFGAAAVLLVRWRKTRMADWLLLAVFGAAGLTAFRNIILTALVGSILIAAYLPGREEKKTWPDWLVMAALAVVGTMAVSQLIPFWAAAALLAVTALIWSGRWLPVAEGGLALLLVAGSVSLMHGSFHLDAAEWKFPVDAANFLLQHHIKGRIFNTYGQGGYLLWRLWPEQQVFQDGRALNEHVFLDAQRIGMNADETNGKSGEQLLMDYGVEVIVVDGFEPVAGTALYLPAALADPSQKEWKLVYQDIHDVIYMKHPPPDVPVLNSLNALEAMEQQCEFYVEHGTATCSKGMVDVFNRIGDGTRARKWFEVMQAAHLGQPFEVKK